MRGQAPSEQNQGEFEVVCTFIWRCAAARGPDRDLEASLRLEVTPRRPRDCLDTLTTYWRRSRGGHPQRAERLIHAHRKCSRRRR